MPPSIDRLAAALLHPGVRPRWRLTLAALLLWVSYKAFSAPSEAAIFEHLDKALHLSAFAVLACVACWSWAPSRRATWAAALGMALYGVFIELVQSQLPLRQASLADLVADGAGIAVGLGIGRWVQGWWAKPAA